MKIASIEQELVADTDTIVTKVLINEVDSHCILTRLMIKALGRPGVDTDMRLWGAGDEWMITWTQPQFTIDQTRAVVMQAIERPAQSLGQRH
jgi:hypothetical protein